MKKKDPKYTKYELDILKYIESGKAKSIPNVKEEIKRYQEIARRSIASKKAISLRLAPNDLEGIKSRAEIEGIPYQTLISSVIHKYLNGTLVEKR